MDPYKTIEEVWDWRKKAYSKLENFNMQERIQEINKILAEGTPPPVINKKFCKNCSYYDLCYI